MATPKTANRFMLFILLWFIVASIITELIDYAIPMSIGMMIFVLQITAFGIPCVVVFIKNKRNIKEILPTQKMGAKNFVMIVAMTIVIVPFITLVAVIANMFFADTISEVVDGVSTESSLLASLFFLAVVPTVFEELVFRGVIYRGYKNVPVVKAAIVNGLFFGIIHTNMQQFFYTAVLGFVWFWFIYYTRSIWAPMLAHFVNNGLQILLGYWTGSAEPMEYYQPELTTGELILSLGLMSFVGMGIFFAIYMFFKAHNLKRNEAIDAEQETEQVAELEAAKTLGKPAASDSWSAFFEITPQTNPTTADTWAQGTLDAGWINAEQTEHKESAQPVSPGQSSLPSESRDPQPLRWPPQQYAATELPFAVHVTKKPKVVTPAFVMTIVVFILLMLMISLVEYPEDAPASPGRTPAHYHETYPDETTPTYINGVPINETPPSQGMSGCTCFPRCICSNCQC